MALTRPLRTAAGATPAAGPVPATPTMPSAAPGAGLMAGLQQVMGQASFRPPTQPVTLKKLRLNADKLNSPVLAAVLRDFYRENVQLVRETEADWVIKVVDIDTVPEHEVVTTRIEMAETRLLGIWRSRQPVAVPITTIVPEVTLRRIVFEQRNTGNQLAVCDLNAPDAVVKREFRDTIDAMLEQREQEIQEEAWDRFERYMGQALGQPTP